jgi:hypothetical protein
VSDEDPASLMCLATTAGIASSTMLEMRGDASADDLDWTQVAHTDRPRIVDSISERPSTL